MNTETLAFIEKTCQMFEDGKISAAELAEMLTSNRMAA